MENPKRSKIRNSQSEIPSWLARRRLPCNHPGNLSKNRIGKPQRSCRSPNRGSSASAQDCSFWLLAIGLSGLKTIFVALAHSLVAIVENILAIAATVGQPRIVAPLLVSSSLGNQPHRRLAHKDLSVKPPPPGDRRHVAVFI